MGKWKKKNTATVFDTVSKRGNLANHSSLEEICVVVSFRNLGPGPFAEELRRFMQKSAKTSSWTEPSAVRAQRRQPRPWNPLCTDSAPNCFLFFSVFFAAALD